MKVDSFRKRLLAKEQELVDALKRTGPAGRERPDSAGFDEGDESVFSESKESVFAQAHRHTRLLNKVRKALQRIENGSYGLCIEDGEKIEPARLDAIPWASYCLKHQAEHDKESSKQ